MKTDVFIKIKLREKSFKLCSCLKFVFVFLRQGLTIAQVSPDLGDPSALDSLVLGLQAHITMPGRIETIFFLSLSLLSTGHMWWCTTIIPEQSRLKQKDNKFKDKLWLPQAFETLSQKNQKDKFKI
jgi:hypothetical protein